MSNVFISADFSTIEMRALAQIKLDMFGACRMADVLRSGEDLHLTTAAVLLGISTKECVERAKAGDKEVEDARQLAKISNFGFPGGLSALTFVDYAAGYGTKVDLATARRAHAAFFETWPEMRAYFDHIERVADHGSMVQVRSGRLRGGITYCSAANGYFQGLAADGCKAALWSVSKECYVVPTSALYGTRPAIFLHDEILAETPWSASDPGRASRAAMRLSTVMREEMEKWIPDIPIVAEPVMTRRLYKGAKPVFIDGILVPSKPVESGDRVKWVADL